jgi:GT2 family glycosyltransferase
MEHEFSQSERQNGVAVPGLVSIVVVNWNGAGYLEECLSSLERQSYSALEIVIVDNGSTDGSCAWLRSRLRAGWRLIELPLNLGFAGGVNTGIRAAHGEFVALLNNDAVAEPEWISSMVAGMSAADTGMVAAKILFHGDRRVIDKAGHLLYPDGLNRGRGAGELDRGQFDSEEEILFPDGCAALYRRVMLDEVGLFDEQFFAYGDDADLGLRARWMGWRCRYMPSAVVYHRHSRSLGKYSPQKAFLVERNRFWVAVKLFPAALLMLCPCYTAWRFFWHTRSIVERRGLAGGVVRDHSAAGLLFALMRAYFSGVCGLPAVLKKRRQVFRKRRICSREFLQIIRRYRISARELACRD